MCWLTAVLNVEDQIEVEQDKPVVENAASIRQIDRCQCATVRKRERILNFSKARILCDVRARAAAAARGEGGGS